MSNLLFLLNYKFAKPNPAFLRLLSSASWFPLLAYSFSVLVWTREIRELQNISYKCSPHVSSHTKAYLTLTSFEKGGDGDGPSECDNKYHSDNTPVVALSTGWFNHKSRCLHNITISGHGG
ncbi:hypothetical protein RJT34_17963 [Clitoria ternatea]|uniref:Uncharacterized protein n=1 Tax=Clitoria ternatea TaxID=43366 RepID=A0AAN9J9X3_CLITE